MTSLLERRELLTVWRRRLFYTWIVASIVAAGAAMIAGPIASTTDVANPTWVALVSPIAMAVFLLTGAAWLLLLVMSHRSKYLRQPPD